MIPVSTITWHIRGIYEVCSKYIRAWYELRQCDTSTAPRLVCTATSVIMPSSSLDLCTALPFPTAYEYVLSNTSKYQVYARVQQQQRAGITTTRVTGCRVWTTRYLVQQCRCRQRMTHKVRFVRQRLTIAYRYLVSYQCNIRMYNRPVHTAMVHSKGAFGTVRTEAYRTEAYRRYYRYRTLR